MAKSVKPPACSTCPFWLAHKGGQTGECREGPPAGPVVVVTKDGPRLALPVTSADHWCGRHPDHPSRHRLTEK